MIAIDLDIYILESMKKKISFTIIDDNVGLDFLNKFGIDTDSVLIDLIEPILGTQIDIEHDTTYSYLESLKEDILAHLNFEFQCFGFESEPFIDGFGREYGCHVFENLPYVQTRRWCIQIIRKEAKKRIDFRTLRKTLTK